MHLRVVSLSGLFQGYKLSLHGGEFCYFDDIQTSSEHFFQLVNPLDEKAGSAFLDSIRLFTVYVLTQ